MELLKTSRHRATQMYTQHPATPFGQHLKISQCLGSLDHAKGIAAPRHREILAGIGSNLQKNTCIWPALVGLAC